MIMELNIQIHSLCHLVTSMILIIYVIPYYFHDYNHECKITISKDHAIMVVKFCNIKSNSNHGRCIRQLKFNFKNKH